MTTSILRGTRKKFITVARESSGMYFPRRVPRQGKYNPQHVSKTKKPKRIIVVFYQRKQEREKLSCVLRGGWIHNIH